MKKNSTISKPEGWNYLVLSVLAICFFVFETVDLIYIFCVEVIRFDFASEQPLGLAGVPIFSNILITLEIPAYFQHQHGTILSKVGIILLIGTAAIYRKVITFDIKYADCLIPLRMAPIIMAFCDGYFLLSLSQRNRGTVNEKTNLLL